VFSTAADLTWNTIPLHEGKATLFSNEIWITLPWQELISLSLLPPDPEDGVEEFCSGDFVKSTDSNYNDGNAFDSGMENAGSQRRGKAREDVPAGYDGNEALLESAVNEAFLTAGGVMFLKVRAPGNGGYVESPIRQIQNQADVLYYSGHGSHNENYVAHGPNSSVNTSERWTPLQAEAAWKNNDLDTVIIAGCSVLDIKDYKNNYEGTGHTVSPGEEWLKTGPARLLGYNYTSH
jgi:hypothetical protein